MFARASGVEAIRIPGYWLIKDASDLAVNSPPHPEERVVLHIHGGGFTSLSARLNDPTTTIGKGIMKHCTSVNRVLSVEYRLSSAFPHPTRHPFPAAVLDCLSCYNYLIRKGFSSSQIILFVLCFTFLYAGHG